jgi:hypothetical protein
VVTVQQVDSVDKYFINGVDRPILQLYQDQTYIFDLSSSTLVPHPFRFSETNTNDGTSTGTPYTTGITGTEERTFVVPTGAPTTLYYYCENHSGMGATVSISPAVDLMLKGNVAVTGTGSLTVPSGTTGQRPTGVSGMIRYNSTLNVYEAWGQTEWKPLSDPPPYPFTSPFTFTNCGASGRFGPTFDEMKSAYGVSGWWQTEANFNEVLGKQGFQLWTVPKTGTYTIKAYGASGQRRQSGSQYGYGAWTQGDFSLTRGEKLVIIVGQYYDHTITGITISDHNNAGGGGGASWVLKEDYGGSGATPSSLYLVAGGGGGETAHNGSGFSHAVSDAVLSSFSCHTTGNGGGGRSVGRWWWGFIRYRWFRGGRFFSDESK